MLSDTHWQILRRWYRLLLGFALVGGIAGMVMLPGLLGKPAPYASSVTLGVGSFVSFDGTAPSDSALASYADSIAKSAGSQQFLARLEVVMREQGVSLPAAELGKRLTATADLGLHRVKVEATGSRSATTELLASQTAQLLIDDVAAEQSRLRASLDSSTQQRASELQRQLSAVYALRVQRLQATNLAAFGLDVNSLIRQGREFNAVIDNLARLTGDGELARLNSEANAIEQELVSIAAAQNGASAGAASAGQTLFVVDPARTVPTRLSGTLGSMEAFVLGVVAGLVLGWVAANVAERMSFRNAGGGALDSAFASTGAGAEPAADLDSITAEVNDPFWEDDPPQPAPCPALGVYSAPATRLVDEETAGAVSGKEADPGDVHWQTLVASPLHGFSEMYSFKKGVAGLSGVRQVKVVSFENRILRLSIDCDDSLPFAQRLRELYGYTYWVIEEDAGRIEIALGRLERV